MATKPTKMPAKGQARRNAGGAATASGMNFQAAVTAIAGSHLLLGASLGWLDGLVDDIPTAIWAETGGPGDDLRIELYNGDVVEAQVKRGLSRGDKLWEALLALAAGLDAGAIQYGVLIVSPDTSKTIWTQLAADSQRLGEGRTDGLSEIGQEWLDRLTAASLVAAVVCARLRIHVVHASTADTASVLMTRAHLARLFPSAADVERLWLRLYQDAHAITERRGRWQQAGLTRMLTAMGLQPSAAATPASVAARVSRWAFDANQSFSLLGAKSLLSIDSAWLPLKAGVTERSEPELADPAAALARYHAVPGNRRSDGNEQPRLDAEWIGRFHTRAVVSGGPGMGKSTLMTQLARLYARDGLPVLKVRLREIAARLAEGHGFDDSVLQLGLDGSGVPIPQARDSSIADWVLLCDGLDECDAHQELVATRIRQFAAGNPRVRIVVTTRPIGYQTGQLSEWRHYELLAPEAEHGRDNLTKLLQAASPKRHAEDPDWARTLAKEQLGGNAARAVISQSPQLLGMAASLLARGGSLGASKTDLYQNLFEIIDAEPNIRKTVSSQPDSVLLARVFDIVGWELMADPLAKVSHVLSRSALVLRADLDTTPLHAQTVVSAALKYWQQVGLIEQVRHGTTALLTFVHKTFAEFAAARFLWTTEDEPERARMLNSCLDDYERWSEVVSFAAARMAEEILQALLERVALGDRHALERALNILVATSVSVSDETAERLARLAFEQVDADNTVMAYRIGLLLVQVSLRFEVIAELAGTRLLAERIWSQRVAWACVLETPSFDIDAAYAKLREFLASSSRTPSVGLFGSLMLRRYPEDALHERMAFALVRRELAAGSRDRLAALLAMFKDQAFDTVGFNMKLGDLARQAGVELPRVRQHPDNEALKAKLPSDEYKQAHATALGTLLDALATLNESFGDGAALEPPLQLSALFAISGWNEAPASDVWSAMEPQDREPVREVLRGIIALSAIHPGQLQREAAAVRTKMETGGADSEDWFFAHIVEVDVPELDWGRAASLGLDRTMLEHAALQRPQWLAISATNLLENLEPPDPDRLAAMLTRAKGLGMWTASYLARRQGDIGLKLLLERLNGPITTGFQYLLRTLARTDAPWTQVATGAGKALHATSPRVAEAAAALALKHIQSGAAVPESLLGAAYQHWLANEEPYPKSSGAIPDSPRKTLLAAMNQLQPFSDERVYELLNDTRGDVRDLALAWLIERASQSPTSRSSLVTSVKARGLSAASVAKLFEADIAFDEAQVSQLSDLFSDAEPAYRLAALRLIKPQRMPSSLLTAKLKALMADTHPEVVRSARTLWDTFVADGIVD